MVRVIVSVPGHRAGSYPAERSAGYFPNQRKKVSPLEGTWVQVELVYSGFGLSECLQGEDLEDHLLCLMAVDPLSAFLEDHSALQTDVFEP